VMNNARSHADHPAEPVHGVGQSGSRGSDTLVERPETTTLASGR